MVSDGLLVLHPSAGSNRVTCFEPAESGNPQRMRMLKRLRRTDPDLRVDDQPTERPPDDRAGDARVDDRPGDVRDDGTTRDAREGVASRAIPDDATARGARDDDARRDVRKEPVTIPRQGEPNDVPDEPVRKETRDHAGAMQGEVKTKAVLRIPSFSVIAPIGGWLAAWGAAAVAIAALEEAGVGIGFGFGIAGGSIDVNSGFWAGLWTLVVQAGAFLFGGYVAGRMARTRAIGHAVLAWFIAMAATAADAIVVAAGSDRSSVLAPLRLPQWAGLDYERTVVVPLIIFAAGALVAAIVGGSLAAGANRLETTNAATGGSRQDSRVRRDSAA